MNLFKSLASPYFLCLFGGCFVYAELTIDVANAACARTYDISKYENITFKYEDNDNVAFRTSSCVFTIVNYHIDKELCIKQTTSDGWGLRTCPNLFKYYMGYLSLFQDDAISCYRYASAPLCTGYTYVYAVFNDYMHLSFLRTSLTVEIYWRNKIVTTTRRTTTTTYYSVYDNSDGTDHSSVTLIIIPIVILVLVACTVCAVGCTKSEGQNAEQPSVQNTQQTEPQVSIITARTSYVADAPTYDSLFQRQHQLPSDQGVTELQTDTGACDGQSPSESQPSHHILLETNLASAPPAEDQHRPTTPPPSYADLGFPPAYPGNT